MINRKIPYGYIIQNGEFAVEAKEAAVVKRIFTAYLAGSSYQSIAEMLNGDEVLFSIEAPLWNKHKVKRLLENPRYIGEQGYPPIAEIEIFEEVQLLIASKTANYRPKAIAEIKAENAESQTALMEVKAVYQPSVDIMKIDNSINRCLEKLDKPEEIIKLILKGITARYMCCG